MASAWFLVIDEFPYLVEKNKAIPSMFQLGWMNTLKIPDVFLMICGSSVSMMERLLGKKSPSTADERGRRRFCRWGWDAFEFFPKYSLRQKIEAYAILGNIPQYLLEFNDKETYWPMSAAGSWTGWVSFQGAVVPFKGRAAGLGHIPYPAHLLHEAGRLNVLSSKTASRWRTFRNIWTRSWTFAYWASTAGHRQEAHHQALILRPDR